MTIWFIADTHFGKQPKPRIKATAMTADELDTLIEERWREHVGDDDTVWHLGDIGPVIDRLASLPDRKHLIKGNDDPSLRKLRDTGLLETAATSRLLDLGGASLFLVHNPSDAPAEPGGAVVHGHTHALTPQPGHRSVSVDRTGWRPLTLNELLARES
jgi:calcineurin-like phosphoesterase family protein